MPVRIETQGAMAKIRGEITFCYTCGSALKAGKYRNEPTDGDHVIPAALFADAPGKNAWRPILDVHRSCHVERKNAQGEEVAILAHKLYVEGRSNLAARNWPKRLLALGLEFNTMIDDQSGETLYLIKGLQDAYKAVWTWVRGIHAVLYKQVLPRGMKHRVYAPAGEAHYPSEQGKAAEARAFYLPKDKAHEVIAAAIRRDRFDGLACWGGRCVYVSTWFPDEKRGHPMCVWGLAYDNVGLYSRGTTFGKPMWLGWYDCIRPPINRSILVPDDA